MRMRFLIPVAGAVFNAVSFLGNQLGLSNLTGRMFWYFVIEAYALTALLGWILSAFGVRPARRRAFWLAVPALILLVILKANQLGNPPQAFPHLQARIDGVLFTDFTEEGSTGLLVVPAVSIGNTGEASIADRFDLTIHLPEGDTLHGERLMLPERLEIPFPDGSALVVFGEDALDRRTLFPIQRGGAATGRLAYLFPSLRSAQLAGGGVFCQLTMLDSWGRPAATQLTAVGAPAAAAGETRDVPGLRSEVKAPAVQPPAGQSPTGSARVSRP